jgi:hypothetical protein
VADALGVVTPPNPNENPPALAGAAGAIVGAGGVEEAEPNPKKPLLAGAGGGACETVLTGGVE